jgi:uncharacterized protein
MDIDAKEKFLVEKLHELKSFGVAYSGGVDSTLILKVARDNGVVDFCAAMGIAPVYFAYELERGKEFCRQCRIKLFEIEVDFFGNASALKNDINRCFYCKKEVFSNIKKKVQDEGYTFLVDGTNLSDLGEDRPGMEAAEELGVVSPLKECGIEKGDIRHLAKKYDIPFWNEPPSACLATRIPRGEIITLEKVKMVEKGELLLKEFGFTGPRLRHHEEIARIELRGDDIGKLNDPEFARKVAFQIKQIGFKYVAVDVEGYRSGST